MKLRPTEKQQEVLNYIKNFCADRGYPPTRKEISAHFGWKSANAAEYHLVMLQRKGYVKLENFMAREIIVSEEENEN